MRLRPAVLRNRNSAAPSHDARAAPRCPEHLGDPAHDRGDFLRPHEDVETATEVRVVATPADAQRDPPRGARMAHRVDRRRDLRIRSPRPASGDRHLELAREVVEGRIAVEERRRSATSGEASIARHRRRGERTADHVAHDVAARAHRRDARVREASLSTSAAPRSSPSGAEVRRTVMSTTPTHAVRRGPRRRAPGGVQPPFGFAPSP